MIFALVYTEMFVYILEESVKYFLKTICKLYFGFSMQKNVY